MRSATTPPQKAMPPAKRVKELTGKRTANTRVFKLSDGRLQAEVSAGPVNFRTRGGTWKPIDTSVQTSDRSGFVFANTTNRFRSYFGKRAGELVRFEMDGTALTLGARGVDTDRVSCKNTTVTYAKALGGSDLTYEVTPTALKEKIVLDRAPSGEVSWSFTVGTKGLRAWQREDGSIAFYRGDFEGEPVPVMPAPFMYDSATDISSPYGKAWSPKVTQSMRWDGKAQVLRITVRPDRAWLADPKRKYPVTVDPTIRIAPTPTDSQDVMIASDAPTTNYDGVWRLSVGGATAGAYRALLQFPLSAVPSGTQIDSAQLETYFDQYHTSNSNAVTLEAHRATAAWNETTATWSSASGITGELGANTELVDDGDAGKTSQVGTWLRSTTFGPVAVNNDYYSSKNATLGDSYTWVPRVTEAGTYKVEVHHPPVSDATTAAPFTVTYDGGSAPYTVDQTAGTGGTWTTLGSRPFAAGTTGKVVLGDVADSSKRVSADAIRLTKDGTQVKTASDAGSRWHSFSVRSIVQGWLNGTNPNYGFVLKAADETFGKGGPRYTASEFFYQGETATYPRLVVTYGRPGVNLESPTVIHATGAELDWSAYTDPSSATGDDIVEYQVHRSVYQAFTPSAATLVAPVNKTTTSFTDTTAKPTPADSSDPFGHSYYYMVAVKTVDGQVIASPVELARLPKAGKVTRIFQGDATDTMLAQNQPTTTHGSDKSLPVGNNDSATGVTRTLVKFPISGISSAATVTDAQVQLWETWMYGSAAATYEMRALYRDFDEATATWNKADATTSWTAPGGDYGSVVYGSITNVYNDPQRRSFTATPAVQAWVANPSINHGFLFKLANETTPAERTLFLSNEAEELQLRPQLVVTYLEKTTDSTYYAPYTSSRMIPGDQYTVDVTVTNTTTATWNTADWKLSYRWTLPDGTDVTNPGNQLQTALPKNVVPGDTVTINAQLKTPIQSDAGNKRTDYVLKWDLYNTTTGQWLSQAEQIPSLDQSVAVEDPTSDQLGLEKFYSYVGKNTGAGGTAMTNLYAGNTVWSYNAFTNPGRGISTFTRMAYNSQDTSATSMGYGWSLQASAPVRLGSPLDFHPNPDPTSVTMTDGDGTSHTFSWNSQTSEWDAPAGVHYYLQRQVVCGSQTEESRAWVMTRPDRSQFFFDCDGYLSSIVDKNGNTQNYVYEQRHSNNKPIKFLRYITDPTGRQTLTIDSYAKGADYTYIDDTGQEVNDTNLSNPHIIDQTRSITDISGRKLTFVYTTQGLMAKMVDGTGSAQSKTFTFTYDATQGTKNVKLVKVTDPRGHDTSLAYYQPPNDDPAFHWWNKSITDRLAGVTTFVYTDPDGAGGSQIQTVVTDAENHASTYLMDGYGRATQTTNAKNQTTHLAWDADNNVTRLEEPPATTGATPAVTTWTYDAKTGYPTLVKDAEANDNGWAGTTLTYQTGLGGHIADLTDKRSPEGRWWHFGYDTEGNLTTVTDPAGQATTEDPDDYTTRYEYDTWGQLTKATDANGHATTNTDFDPVGYPKTITDPLGKATTFVYDERGQVTKVTDTLGHDTTQTYDTFGRPLQNVVPKDQAGGVFITTPAPEYDANDNVTRATAPNGAVTTAVYDAADQVTASFAPKDHETDPERKTAFSYDRAGNLLKQTEPKGTLTTGDDTDYVTSYTYDEIYQLTQVTNAKGGNLTYSYDDVGNVTTLVDPRKNATSDPDDFTTRYVYDLNHRVTTTTDAAGKTVSSGYDRDGLVVSTTDQENNTTLVTLDARGKPSEVKVPHKDDGGIVYNTTQFVYDQVGNRTKVISPRGVATTGVADDFVSETVYDELNRVKEQLTSYDPGDARYNTPDKTIYTYDAVGRLAKVSSPPSQGQSVRNDTTYSYFDNGWAKTSTDPWDIVTSYDYNPLGKQTSRTLTSAGGSSNRTMSWAYYPDGKLQARADEGVPVGKQVVLVDDSDTQNAGSTGGTWTSATAGSGFQGYDYAIHPAGTGTTSFVWNLTIPQDGSYEVFVKYPSVSGATTTAKYTVGYDGGSTDQNVDQTSGGGTWASLGSYTFKRDSTSQQKITLSDQATSGTVLADAVKLVRSNTGETDNEKADFTYAYDPNGNLTDITDQSPNTQIDAYTIGYTELNQAATIEEKLNSVVKHTTTFTYNANSNPITRGHDEASATYEYDIRDLPSKITDKQSASDPSPKVTTFTYTPRAQRDIETKGNGNTVDYDYYLDGTLQHQIEKKPNGTIVSEHTLAYDPNGNKTQDIATKMNADNHAAYISTTTNWTYDPLNRIAQATKTGDVTSTETYIHDPNNNVTSQTIKNTTTTFNYDRNRLLTTATSGTTASYNYDPFGRLDTITSAGQIIERNTYNGFDHVTENQKQGTGGLATTRYTYDPLDRTTSKTTNAGQTEEKTTTYAYLGLSNDILDEHVAGQITKSYQYSPWGERLSQVKHNTDGSKEDGYYGTNDHTDVETLTDQNGDTKATYGYTAYGQNEDTETTGIDKPDPQDPTKEPYNPYRYNSKRFDQGSGTYDMGFRNYNPGLNRFLTRDMYNGALNDMNLGADPFTANRYAFGAGNPTNNIENDGHEPCPSGNNCDYLYTGDEKFNNETSSKIGYAQLCSSCMSEPMTSAHFGVIADAARFDVKGAPKWTNWDALKYATDKLDIFAFKRAWVSSYRDVIKAAAHKYNLPEYLIAGIAFNEVGGDPSLKDDYAYFLGGNSVSFGDLSMNVDTAAESLGYDPKKLTWYESNQIISSLKDPVQGIFLAARHMSQVRTRLMYGKGAQQLTNNDVRKLGAWYNGGPQYWNTSGALSYGDNILERRSELENLLE